MARPPAIETETGNWVALDVSSLKLTDDQLVRLFRDNEEYQFELSADGELIIMPPPHNQTELSNTKFTSRLFNWAERDGTGVVFGNNTLFTLPNGAKRGPDTAWVSKARWDSLSEDEKNSFSNLVPEFVMELRSRSDRLKTLKGRMEEYMANGVRLAWLLDPIANCATIYRANESPIEIGQPSIIRGDPVLPGFKFDFRELL